MRKLSVRVSGKWIRIAMLATAVAACETATAGNSAVARQGIDIFNRALIDATTRMDNAATLALWNEHGIALLPQTKPAIGVKAIGEFLDQVMAQLSHARMEKFEMKCHDITIAGDLASEWCEEHQRVNLGDGKDPFDGAGVMLLVLHRDADGRWRMLREMWNQAAAVEADHH